MPESEAKEEAIKGAANALAEAHDADIIAFNYEVIPPVDFLFIKQIGSRQRRRKKAFLFLTTEGGSADSAFRIMRFLQLRYEHITIVVPGWCKSAGTLMCVGANDLVIGDAGELGPLDVQIAKVDEMDEQKSGLAAEAAFEKLQSESFKFFMNFVRDFGESEYRVTLKTASDIASKMTIGVMQPIFDKLDPVTIGEDYRSNRLALSYAERLNLRSRNLNRNRGYDALDNLLAGYESHGFVIDRQEAEKLFKRVKAIPDDLMTLAELLETEMLFPRSRRLELGPKLEFLNDELQDAAEGAIAPDREDAAEPDSSEHSNGHGNGSAELPGNPGEGGEAESPPLANGAG